MCGKACMGRDSGTRVISHTESLVYYNYKIYVNSEPDYGLNFNVIFRLAWNMSSGLLNLFATDRKRHLGSKSSLERTEMMINNSH